MYAAWMDNLIVVAATLVAVALSVLTHYEGLFSPLTAWCASAEGNASKFLYGIASVLCLHVARSGSSA
jgi:hypothetical protein